MDANAKAEHTWLTVSCDDVPRCRIERYRCQRKEEGCFGCVDEGTERHDCYVVVEDNRATTLMHGQKSYVHRLRRVYDTTPRHLLVGIGLHKATCIHILINYGRVV
jgi:hypothetical protein